MDELKFKITLARKCLCVGGVIFSALHNDLAWIVYYMCFEEVNKYVDAM